jgi:hypothetical protein
MPDSDPGPSPSAEPDPPPGATYIVDLPNGIVAGKFSAYCGDILDFTADGRVTFIYCDGNPPVSCSYIIGREADSDGDHDIDFTPDNSSVDALYFRNTKRDVVNGTTNTYIGETDVAGHFAIVIAGNTFLPIE